MYKSSCTKKWKRLNKQNYLTNKQTKKQTNKQTKTKNKESKKKSLDS